MNVSDLYERLSYGELSNLHIGLEGQGDVSVDDKPRVLSYINLGLTALYSRFTHKRDYVSFLTQENRTRYELTLENALSQNAAGFIQDTALEPFPDNLIKVIEVSIPDDPATADIDEFVPLSMNRRRVRPSIQALSYNTLRIRDCAPGTLLEVEYQAGHPRVTGPDDRVHVAPVLEEALEMFVAGKIYSSMNGEGNLVKASSLSNRYEQICARVDAADLLLESGNEAHDKFTVRGFV